MLGVGVTDELTEAQGLYQLKCLGSWPQEPQGCHGSLLAPVPTAGKQPGGVWQCQLLGLRRGAGSALSRKSLRVRCRGGELGELPARACWGWPLAPRDRKEHMGASATPCAQGDGHQVPPRQSRWDET